MVSNHSEQCTGSAEAAEDCTPLRVTSVTFLILSHTCTHTADHHHMKILSPVIREVRQYLSRKIQREAGKHFTGLKASLKQVPLSKAVQQGASYGLNALLDIACHNYQPRNKRSGENIYEIIFRKKTYRKSHTKLQRVTR